MGHTKYLNKCKRVYFKNVIIETKDSSLAAQKSISIMKDYVIEPTMDTLVSYTDSKLDSYRSVTHDAILIYGFIIEHAATGAVKARFRIEDGVTEWQDWSDCSVTCGDGTQTRTRTCSIEPENFDEPVSEEQDCSLAALSLIHI